MPSLTVENYVKAIYQLGLDRGGEAVATGQLATALAVSPGTVTSMLKTLSESALVEYMPYTGVSLTAAGQVLALRVIRRHRLIEVFLARTLEMNWDEVHEEAEHMEHAVSDLLIDRIDKFLGYPSVDPHGDPIPRADGTLLNPTTTSLADTMPGQRFKITRVVDQSPEFLRFLTNSGITLDAMGTTVSKKQEAGLVVVRVGNHETSLGMPAAGKIQVVEI